MTTPDDNRSMRERMLAGDLYRGADDELVAEMEQAMRLTKRYNDSEPGDTDGRRSILKELLGEVGEDVDIRPPLHCDYGSHISVGARTFINFGLMALDVATITIGEDVLMGPNVQLLTPTRDDSPVAKYLERKGEGLHHVGYRVADCGAALDSVKAHGGRVIDEAPRPGSRGTTVAFVHPKGAFGTLIELVQE